MVSARPFFRGRPVQGEARLRAVERLDLAHLVNRQDHRVVGRIEIRRDGIDHVPGELQIVRQLD
jgi:hypothetical protein